MRKREISVVLVILLLLSLVTPALAASPQLTVRAPGALPDTGQSFTVTVEISGNPGICTAEFTLGFDSSVVDCTEVELGTALNGMLAATNPDASDGARVAAAAVDAVTRNGVLAEFTFKVLKSGKPNFSLKNAKLGDSSGAALDFSTSVVEKESGKTLSSETASAGFSDTKNHWCRAYAEKAAEMGLFKGYPDGSFHPNDAVTRAQFVTVLYRMAGSPDVTVTAPFTDISGQSAEFRKAITWAYEKKLVSGRSEKIFDPDASVTRQEAMKVLFQYSGGQSGMEMMFTATYDSAFTDSKYIASWAKAGIYWAYYHELITGTSSTTVTPTGVASRGQLAKILVNYSEKFGN